MHVAIFTAGSVAFVALMSLLLVRLAQAILPAASDEADPDDTEAEEATSTRSTAKSRRAKAKSAVAAAKPAAEPEEPPQETEAERWGVCCDALDDVVKAAPSEDQIIYQSAARACRGLAGSAQGRQTIKNLLDGRSVPPECR